MSGLNRVDQVYYINLDHRQDRLVHIQGELAKTNIALEKCHRISAIHKPGFGALGCTLSHIVALEQFIGSGQNTCIVFEDDFQFIQDQTTVNQLVDSVFGELPEFDVVLLAAYTQSESPIPPFTFVTKTMEACTTAGYMVSKHFAPILLENFRESATLSQRLGYQTFDYCLDQYWKRLQPITEWYTLSPRIGKQMETYSDIQRSMVQYWY